MVSKKATRFLMKTRQTCARHRPLLMLRAFRVVASVDSLWCDPRGCVAGLARGAEAARRARRARRPASPPRHARRAPLAPVRRAAAASTLQVCRPRLFHLPTWFQPVRQEPNWSYQLFWVQAQQFWPVITCFRKQKGGCHSVHVNLRKRFEKNERGNNRHQSDLEKEIVRDRSDHLTGVAMLQ